MQLVHVYCGGPRRNEVVSVGAFVPSKQPETAIRAVAAVGGWSLAFATEILVPCQTHPYAYAALQAGHGAILLSAHFTTMEIGGRLLSMFVPFQVLYREHKNAAMEYVIHRGRDRFTNKAILRDNLLGMLFCNRL